MSDTPRSAFLKAVRFDAPDYVPMTFKINDACWRHYEPDALLELMDRHPFLFPADERSPDPTHPSYENVARRDEPFTDDFGCVWTTAEDGITGTVSTHPLADWENYASYILPDPAERSGTGSIDWAAERRTVERRRAEGKLTVGKLRHGHTFLRLCDLRGYQNLMFDFADDAPEISDLIGRLEDFNTGLLSRWLDLGVDVAKLPEDLGMQVGPMLSPAHFRRFVQPSYRRFMEMARRSGAVVHMHSDGDLRDLADDLLEGGVDVLNLQDLVNGIDWIASRFHGRTCVELDIDRQTVTAHGTPEDVDRLIREEVERIGTRQGGLMMVYGLYPGVPLANVRALMDAMERYAFFYA